MPRLALTPAAQANLIEIADYIESESGSIDVAERFVGRLLAKCEELAALPGHMGRQRSEPTAIKLSAEDQQCFAEALIGPAPLPPAMGRAISRHRRLIGSQQLRRFE